MVRMFTGVEDEDCPPGSVTKEHFDLAVENAEKYFTFIAFQEKAAADCPALLRAFGWKATELGRVNIGDYPHGAVDPSWPRAIEALDKWDIRLYEHLSNHFQNGKRNTTP